MVIGICKIVLHIGEAYSLKEKRQIIKSIIERTRVRFNASIAEVGLNDKWNCAEIGIGVVSNEASQADSMMANLVNFIDNDGRVFLSDYSTEIIYID